MNRSALIERLKVNQAPHWAQRERHTSSVTCRPSLRV
jgi:hypothetical protein